METHGRVGAKICLIPVAPFDVCGKGRILWRWAVARLHIVTLMSVRLLSSLAHFGVCHMAAAKDMQRVIDQAMADRHLAFDSNFCLQPMRGMRYTKDNTWSLRFSGRRVESKPSLGCNKTDRLMCICLRRSLVAYAFTERQTMDGRMDAT